MSRQQTQHFLVRRAVVAASALCALAIGCLPTTPRPGIADDDVSVVSDSGGESEDSGRIDGGVPDAGAWIDAADYCERVAGFFCPFYLRCGRIAATDAESCAALFAESCESKYEPRYRALEAAGLLRLNRAGTDACAEHLMAVDCDEQPMDLAGPCSGMWQGTQGAGEACGFDLESLVCAPGHRCRLDPTFCGTCEPTSDVGGLCSTSSDCNPMTSFCADNGKCEAKAELDEECAARPCLPGLRCEGDVCTARSFASIGGPCSAGFCPYGTECIEEICEPLPVNGESCAELPCENGNCEDEICVEGKEPGQSCLSGELCLGGFCDDGVCASLPSACFGDSQ